MADRPERVCLGAIAGAHGGEGLVGIKSFTEKPADIGAYGPLSDEAGERRFALHVTGRAKGVVLARIDGVTNRTQAEALKGTRLYLPRAALPAPAADEYYYADLVGLAVELPDGTVVGTVLGVDNFGAGDVLDVATRPPSRSTTGAGGAVVAVPFTRATVPVVDLDGGRIVVNPLPGLFAAEDDGAGDDRGGGG